MTYMIRHHTEQLHRQATKRVPAFILRNDPFPEHYEAAYARAMKALASKEGHMKRVPANAKTFYTPPSKLPKQPDRPALDAAILKALTRELTTTEIAQKVGSKKDIVARRLGGPLAPDVTRRDARLKGSRVVFWSLASEPHVSCKDRIAAAKREATK